MPLPKDCLFTLIHSMSSTDKANFKKFGINENNRSNIVFLDLFDTINKQLEYKEDIVKSILAKKHNLSNFSKLKKELYELILDYLISIDTDHKSYFNHLRNMMRSHYLHKKRNYLDAKYYIDLNIDAVKSNNLNGCIAINELENALSLYKNLPNFLHQYFEIFDLYKHKRDSEQLEFEFRCIQIEIFKMIESDYYLLISESNVEKTKQLIFRLQSLKIHEDDIPNQYRCFQNLSQCYSLILDKKNEYQYTCKLKDLLDNNFHLVAPKQKMVYLSVNVFNLGLASDFIHYEKWKELHHQFLSDLSKLELTLDTLPLDYLIFYKLTTIQCLLQYGVMDNIELELTDTIALVFKKNEYTLNTYANLIPFISTLIYFNQRENARRLISRLVENLNKIRYIPSIEIFLQIQLLILSINENTIELTIQKMENIRRLNIVKNHNSPMIFDYLKLIKNKLYSQNSLDDNQTKINNQLDIFKEKYKDINLYRIFEELYFFIPFE